MTNRKFTPYEKNQLLKHSLSLNLDSSNQTPVEYLTGHVEFSKLDFLVDSNVLIPRIETEEIITIALEELKSKNDKLSTILDLATGSGALGISLSYQLLKKNQPHHFYLSDISPNALKLAQKNASRLLPQSQPVTFINSDLLKNFPPLKFDLVLANLPYIPTKRINTLDPSVKNYEPHLALDGGIDGAQIINRLLEQLPNFLSPKSHVILEIDHTHTLKSFKIPAMFAAQILPDQFGQNRFLILKSN